MLLPLRLSGWGKAGTQTYENGVLTLAHDYSCSLEDWDNHNVPVNDPAFRFYCNDVKVTERPATLSTEGLQAGIYDYGNGGWPDVFPCEIGDTMRITFVCTDDYGLTYEFTIERWTVSEGDTTEEVQVDSDNYPELSWK